MAELVRWGRAVSERVDSPKDPTSIPAMLAWAEPGIAQSSLLEESELSHSSNEPPLRRVLVKEAEKLRSLVEGAEGLPIWA
jgi:hypothetical protein